MTTKKAKTMKIPPEITNLIVSIVMTAQMRGWIDPRSLLPLIKMLVDKGYALNVRQFLGEVLQLLEQVENAAVRPGS